MPGHDDLARPSGPGDLRMEETERPVSENQDAITRLQPGALKTFVANGGGFGQASGHGIDRGRHGMSVDCVNRHIFRPASGDAAPAQMAKVRAEVPDALPAASASATAHHGIQGHALAQTETLHSGPDLGNSAGHFMPKDQRRLGAEFRHVKIRGAHGRRFHAHDHFARPGFRIGKILDAEPPFTLPDERFHLRPPCRMADLCAAESGRVKDPVLSVPVRSMMMNRARGVIGVACHVPALTL